MNIFTNYVPNKHKSFDDQDPPWMNDRIKLKIKQKNSVFKEYVKNGKTAHVCQNLQFAITELSELYNGKKEWVQFSIKAKFKHTCNKCNKTYCTILKAFYSGKKIPLIPPLIINDQLITDFQEKANYFNLHFAKQCTPIENDSSIPTETKCLCDATISAVDFEDQDILKTMQALDINDAYGHDNILTHDKNLRF